jgi:hypothetical protein
MLSKLLFQLHWKFHEMHGLMISLICSCANIPSLKIKEGQFLLEVEKPTAILIHFLNKIIC